MYPSQNSYCQQFWQNYQVPKLLNESKEIQWKMHTQQPLSPQINFTYIINLFQNTFLLKFLEYLDNRFPQYFDGLQRSVSTLKYVVKLSNVSRNFKSSWWK